MSLSLFPFLLLSSSLLWTTCFSRFPMSPGPSPTNSSPDDCLSEIEREEREREEREREGVCWADFADDKSSIELKNAARTFDRVWEGIENRRGKENMKFPKEIIWLIGAPGSGKGTNVNFILKEREITGEAIEVSKLLENIPSAREMKARGQMVTDHLVLSLLLATLLEPQYQTGAVVDGFPRTKVQVEFLKLLQEKLLELRRVFAGTGLHYRRPHYRICVLYVDETTSVQRQLARGARAVAHNQNIPNENDEVVPVPVPMEVRPTDLDPELALLRYKTFQNYFGTLNSLREVFSFTMINAMDEIEVVQARIKKEFEYQSQNEISSDTLNAIQNIPILSEIKKHARHLLIQRLDSYQTYHSSLFSHAIALIQEHIVPEMKKHVFGGVFAVEISNQEMKDASCVQMMLDVLAERGFEPSVLRKSSWVPDEIDPETYKIKSIERIDWQFQIKFTPVHLRQF